MHRIQQPDLYPSDAHFSTPINRCHRPEGDKLAGVEIEMKKVLLINAHQFYEGISSGGLNKTMAGVIQEEMEKRGYGFQQTEIDQSYDIADEVQKHLWADCII